MKKSINDLIYNLIKAKPMVSLFFGKTRKLKLTWHHLDDLDPKVQSHFELVHRKVHDKTIQHLGSFFQMEQLLKLIN